MRGRAGVAGRALTCLGRLLTGRHGFVTLALAKLALVNFGTLGCDCGGTHFDRTALGANSISEASIRASYLKDATSCASANWRQTPLAPNKRGF